MSNYNPYSPASGQNDQPYGAQQPVQPAQPTWQAEQPAAGAHQQSGYRSQYPGWEYYNNAWHAVQPQAPKAPQAPTPPPKREKKRGKGAVRAVALMLACLLCGFGGGYAALNLYEPPATPEPDQTVIYKSPETNTNGASGVNDADELSVSDIAEVAGKSVVSITTENEVRDFYTGGRVVSGAGSGVIISEDGYIVTNHHVIEGASNVIVTLPDGSEYPATLVGTDQRTDVAVIKIDATGLSPAVMGNSDDLKVGEFCLAIGNPMGTLGGTVTNGIISALNREITISGNTMNLLQMSAAVSPGNSGGGLFNSKGELVGVVNAKSAGSETEGLGFAIPVNTVLSVVEDLMASGYVTGRPGIGVNIQVLTTEMEAAQAGYPSPGVYIVAVNADSAAEAAGLQEGDKVVRAAGIDIVTGDDLLEIIRERSVGDALELVIERDGRQMNVTVTLGELVG